MIVIGKLIGYIYLIRVLKVFWHASLLRMPTKDKQDLAGVLKKLLMVNL